MITSSIVTYKTDIKELMIVVNCTLNSNISNLYIIDNSPTDDLKKISELSDKIEYIWGHGNIGYGRGHNIAINRSIQLNASYHVVLNPDILFDASVITHLSNYLDENPDVGHIMPLVKYPNGDIQFLCKLVPTPIDLLFKRFLPKDRIDKRMRKFQLQFTGYNKIMNVPYLSGCFMFLRISVLRDIGLFDERFFMYPEDVDLTRRIHQKYKTIFYPKVEIIHAHAAESYQSKRMLWIHMTNMIKYFNKWGWFFDKKRTEINRRVLSELKYK